MDPNRPPGGRICTNRLSSRLGPQSWVDLRQDPRPNLSIAPEPHMVSNLAYEPGCLSGSCNVAHLAFRLAQHMHVLALSLAKRVYNGSHTIAAHLLLCAVATVWQSALCGWKTALQQGVDRAVSNLA